MSKPSLSDDDDSIEEYKNHIAGYYRALDIEEEEESGESEESEEIAEIPAKTERKKRLRKPVGQKYATKIAQKKKEKEITNKTDSDSEEITNNYHTVHLSDDSEESEQKRSKKKALKLTEPVAETRSTSIVQFLDKTHKNYEDDNIKHRDKVNNNLTETRSEESFESTDNDIENAYGSYFEEEDEEEEDEEEEEEEEETVNNYYVVHDDSNYEEDDNKTGKYVCVDGKAEQYPIYGPETPEGSLNNSRTSNSELASNSGSEEKGLKAKKKRKKSMPLNALLKGQERSPSEPQVNPINTTNCYWNTEFQRALDMNEGRAQWTKLAKLAHDFVYCSKTYGKIIITEYYLPEEQKTIKSIDAGGLAGGSKYICSNIFFKFALDTDLNEDKRKKKGLTEEQLPPLWMYGGETPDDYAAMKASKNDMTGLMSYYNAKVPGLYFPLMALIDYRGFRLIAMSILPISRSTIRYGSADGGQTIHKGSPDISKKMKDVAEQLNLKGHRTGQKRIMVYGPGDIEGHEGRDGKFYVVDFGRTFPPEAPSSPKSRKIFYCLLRPEFVRMYPKPLSSDAFSCWGKCNSKIHNLEVREATEYLYNTCIINFAKELSKKKDLNDIRLTETLHSFGINCRHLGRVRHALPPDNERIATVLMTEMVARLLSGLLRQLLRLEMKRTKVASQEPYKTVVIDFINALLVSAVSIKTNRRLAFVSSKKADTLENTLRRSGPALENISEAKALRQVKSCSFLREPHFWTRDVKNWIETKFTMALTKKERHPTYRLTDSIHIEPLLQRLCDQSGIKLSKHAMDEFNKHPDTFQVLNFDLRKVSARVKHLNVIDEAEGNLLFLEARNYSHREGLWEATNQKFRSAVCSNTNNPATFVRWGSILLKQCNHFRLKVGGLVPPDKDESVQLAEKLLGGAEEKFHSALKLNNRMHEAQYELANTYVFKGVLVHLTKPKDTIAIALWDMEAASRNYHLAFHANSHYFQKLLMQVDELTAQASQTSLPSDIRGEHYLRAFFMLHCAIAVAPRIPEPSTFLHAAFLIKEYLTIGGQPSIASYLYGLASSYLESAYLKIPSISDGRYLYHYQKSVTQMEQSGTRPNLATRSTTQRKSDVVLLYKIDEATRGSEHALCSLQDSIDVKDIPSHFPLTFYPVVCDDPSHSYHHVRSLHRLFHLLGPFDWNLGNNSPSDSSDSSTPSDVPPMTSFSKQSCTFVLCHSPFHSFVLSHITVLLPVIENRNVGLPKQINFYISNCEDRYLLTKENIAKATNNADDNSAEQAKIQQQLKWHFLHSIDISAHCTKDGPLQRTVILPKQLIHARFLIIDVVPTAEGREVGLCKLGFRGNQYYKKTVPHKPFMGTKHGSKRILSTLALSASSDLSPPTLPLSSITWSDKHSNMMHQVDGKSSLSLEITQKDEEGEEGGMVSSTMTIPYTCQSTIPFSYRCPSILRKTSHLRHIDTSTLGRDRRGPTSEDLSISMSNVRNISSDGPLYVLWIDLHHSSNDTRTLCQLANTQNVRLRLIPITSVENALSWLQGQHEDTLVDTASIRLLIDEKALRIVITEEANMAALIPIEDILENELWNQIPLMVYNSMQNPEEPTTNRQDREKLVFYTTSAISAVDFASFTIHSSELHNIRMVDRTPSENGSKNHYYGLLATRVLTGPSSPSGSGSIGSGTSKTSEIFQYFEISLQNLDPSSSSISIGLAPFDFAEYGCTIGSALKSFAYRNDGTLWVGWGQSPCHFTNHVTPPFHTGDVIGCGFDSSNKQIYWTKNGFYLGPAFRGHSKLIDLDTSLYPSVSITGNCRIEANFGKEPFLFELARLSSYTNPKLSNPNKKETLSAVHPYAIDLFHAPLRKHNMDLLVLSVLAQFSRTLHILMKAHLATYQGHTATQASMVHLLDSTELARELGTERISYSTIDLSNTNNHASDLHVCSLYNLIPTGMPNTLHMGGWQTLKGSNVFGNLLHPENIHSLLLHDCALGNESASLITERFINLHSVALWPTISDVAITSICSIPSLRNIDFSHCIHLNDALLISMFKKSATQRESFESLNFTNCLITDSGLSSFASKCVGVIRNLRTLNLNYCDNISHTGIMKVLHCCKHLQHISLACNPSRHGMTDHLVSYIAQEYNQKLQTLVLIRSTHLSAVSMNLIASYCHNLTYLDLAHCSSVSDASLQNIAECGNHLLKLDLFNTKITDITATKFVSNHQNLRYLSFARCGELSARGIISCFKYMPNVEFLFLRENYLPDNVLQVMCTVSLPSLVLVDVSSCSQVSADAIKSLQAALPHVFVNTSHSNSKKYQTKN